MAHKRILVTGASGFVGHHLAQALHRAYPDAQLYGTSRKLCTVNHMAMQVMDICQRQAVASLIEWTQPDAVIHLAAQAHVPTSFDQPLMTWQTNLEGTRNLLDACQEYVPRTRIINIGSADMYGATFRRGAAVTEASELLPLNPYAASKCAADLLAWQVSQTSTLDIIRVRAFNHVGPGQSDSYALSSFARQIAAIELGLQAPVLETGSLNVERDITDVQDLVRAYVLLLDARNELASGSAVNIGRGKASNLGQLLGQLVAKAQLNIEVQQDPSRVRPTDIQTVACDISVLRKATGWQPEVSLDEMLDRLLADWRNRLSRSALCP